MRDLKIGSMILIVTGVTGFGYERSDPLIEPAASVSVTLATDESHLHVFGIADIHTPSPVPSSSTSIIG